MKLPVVPREECQERLANTDRFDDYDGDKNDDDESPLMMMIMMNIIICISVKRGFLIQRGLI